jgi:heat shock transcription factor
MVASNAEAGPSRLPPPKVESLSPSSHFSVAEEPEDKTSTISKNGLSVDENGEVSKLPAFLTKLYK